MFYKLRGIASLRWAALPLAAAQSLSHGPAARCGGSKHDAVQKHKVQLSETDQYEQAAAWCNENKGKYGCGAAAAVNRKSESGELLWPDISQGSLNRRLNGTVSIADPHATRRALLPSEELAIIQTCKLKNLHGQGIDRQELSYLVMESLAMRPVLNAGRNYMPLNQAAKKMVAAGHPGMVQRVLRPKPQPNRKACVQ